MHIAIDARFWGIQNTGLGRYTMNLVTHLAQIDRDNKYTLLVKPESQSHIKVQLSEYANFKIKTVDAQHYSVKEQYLLPLALTRLKPDILHVPHFNIPVFWTGPLVVTIHDLIKQTNPTPESTTRSTPVYWLKYFTHLQVIKAAVAKASAILVPSQFTQDQVVSNYPTAESKTQVIPLAPDQQYYQTAKYSLKQLVDQYKLQLPYLLYVGNAYPHKNLPILIQAIKEYNKDSTEPLHLIIVCGRDVFQARVEQLAKQSNISHLVKFIHLVPDQQLASLYSHAVAFVTPSLLEGFGLPGLEAMAAGTPVIAAKASCLPEIYAQHATYFNPESDKDLAKQITKLINQTSATKLNKIQAARNHAQTFTWQRTAEQTLKAYQTVYHAS